jgi:hypothetical protein
MSDKLQFVACMGYAKGQSLQAQERTAPKERRRPACSEREARIMHLRFSRLRRSVQASRLRSIGSLLRCSFC